MSPSNSKISEKAVQLVMEYLEWKGEHPRKGEKGEGADIISDGKDGCKYIDVKGCWGGKATNLRMVPQALDSIAELGGLREGSFFIYYVCNISKSPELRIFGYSIFKKHKLAEIKWLIQPAKIINETGKPQPEKDFPRPKK